MSGKRQAKFGAKQAGEAGKEGWLWLFEGIVTLAVDRAPFPPPTGRCRGQHMAQASGAQPGDDGGEEVLVRAAAGQHQVDAAGVAGNDGADFE